MPRLSRDDPDLPRALSCHPPPLCQLFQSRGSSHKMRGADDGHGLRAAPVPHHYRFSLENPSFVKTLLSVFEYNGAKDVAASRKGFDNYLRVVFQCPPDISHTLHERTFSNQGVEPNGLNQFLLGKESATVFHKKS